MPLVKVCFPEERVTVDDSPFARRLAAADIEVQMRPTDATAIFAQHADALTHLDPSARLHRWIERRQVAVTIVPAKGVEQVDHVITWIHWSFSITWQFLRAGGDHQAVGGRGHGHQVFSAPHVESVVVVDLLDERVFATVDEARFIGHLRAAGEPALLRRVAKYSR